MAVNFEARPYGPDSTEEEIKAIQDRVYLFKYDIVMFKELPVQSVFQIDLFFNKIAEIAANLEYFYMIIDLSEANRPSAEVRDHLKKRAVELTNLKYVSIFTGGRLMLNIAAKFVCVACGMKSYSVKNTLEEALEAVYVIKQD
jgi:hypothetical protein